MSFQERPRESNSPETLPTVTPAERERLLTGVLRGVSRAFYLTLRVLPRELRESIGLAYLLGRAADTIADTRLLSPAERLDRLRAFRAQVEGPANMGELGATVTSVAEGQSSPRERALLGSLPLAFAVLESLPDDERGRVRSVVVTLTHGMEMDLTSFPQEDSGGLAAFESGEQLDNYTYLVAGCVGVFWTEFIAAKTPALAGWDVERMSELGVRFGKALQMTNVLRDVPRDLRNGRCYLPVEWLAGAGLAPERLLEPDESSEARPILARGVRDALEHYRAVEPYVLSIPRRCLRLRLATLWPALMGLATLQRLVLADAWLDPSRPAKVSRGWVYRMMVLSFLLAPSNSALKLWSGRLRQGVERSLMVE